MQTVARQHSPRVTAGQPKRWIIVGFAVIVLSAVAVGCTVPTGGGRHPNPYFCNRVSQKKLLVSQGARMYCFGAEHTTGAAPRAIAGGGQTVPENVAASNLNEDVAPNGTRAYGQSETSVAANGPYVVEAWNDATSFLSDCGAAQYKEEATGLGFSADGGHTFTDLGGLPNNNCNAYRYGGDPSVETATVGGTAYFYISSLFNSLSGTEPSKLAMAVCTATGSGASANLACSQPVTIAQSSECGSFDVFVFCSFLDKEYLTIDPVRHRLYASYTEFGFDQQPDTIELAVCNISNPGVPTCHNGAGPGPRAPYMVVTPSPANGCENEGAYPAVDLANGDVYVAYEHNVDTNLFGPTACLSDPVRNVVKRIPHSALTLPTATGGPNRNAAINITSMDAAFVPGYNRFPANDFPRIAVSDHYGTVSLVWNDARFHPLGDILMQSYTLGSLAPVSGPVQLNANTPGLHFLPALRNADSSGKLNVTWYERATNSTTLTNVVGAFRVSPLATSAPASTLITSVPSDWNVISSDITPNFGDYTDNYVRATEQSPYVDTNVAVAWSDGREGVPQAFFASEP